MGDPTSPPAPADLPAQGTSGTALNISNAARLSNPTPASSPSAPESVPDSRKSWLSLLPHEQIIEICLLFEPHVPLEVKSTVWPADLEAAILELRKKAPALTQPKPNGPVSPTPIANGTLNSGSADTPIQQVHPPGHHVGPPPNEDPPMGSLKDPAQEAREKEQASAANSASSSSVQMQANGADPSSSRQQTPHPGTPQPPGQPQHPHLHPSAPYPYGPYGYPVPPPQGAPAAYPHAPYYPSYGSPYPYPPYPPHPGYPAPPPGHASPPGAHGNQPLFTSNPLVRPPIPPGAPGPPQQQQQPPAEDLPSYEEMIVEALVDCGDAEGAAPKDLFTWMASRYPLQTNFRPSASQALQKAYKRGRLEKRQGGKYRLNPSWEGGATSKRTTRRPQTLQQTIHAMHHPPQTSPFTNAPLHHPHQSPPPAPAQQPPFNGYPYQYPYGHYPGFPPRQPDKPAAPPASVASTSKPSEDKNDAIDGGDAWEAAQHILNAINFSGLAPGSGDQATRVGSSSVAQAAGSNASVDADELGAVLSALAAAAAASNADPPRSTLSDDERASLQAQLALLAAQLTEIADSEEDDVPPALPAPASVPAAATAPAQFPLLVQPASLPTVSSSLPPTTQPPTRRISPQAPPQPPIETQAPSQAQSSPPRPRPVSVSVSKPPSAHPPPIAAYTGAHLVLDINAFPEIFSGASASGAQTEVEADADMEMDTGVGAGEDSDEDDMEDVVVPMPGPPVSVSVAGHNALRT